MNTFLTKLSLLIAAISYVSDILLPAQNQFPTKTLQDADSLRGTLTPFRTCYDVYFYDLTVQPELQEGGIIGKNTIFFTVIHEFDWLQIDLFPQLVIDSIVWGDQLLHYGRRHGAVFVHFPVKLTPRTTNKFTVYYHGKPTEAANPPWDGGFVHKKDKQGRPWLTVACQGFGASSWWPLKDHLADEPDSQRITIRVPNGITAVSNGVLRSVLYVENNLTEFEWFVSYPINSYSVTMNVAYYEHFLDTFQSSTGIKQLDYYVLPENLPKARDHFQQTKTILRCFEKYFGEYPFWRDGFCLVETPYWGMEHQGAIAYGNNYKNNHWGFDYIIVHESGHEWFGNSISMQDNCDMWIHESFTTYSEALFMECTKGYKESVDYLLSERFLIQNDEPILGPPGINYDAWKSADMYYKGAWMLHTIRNILQNDSLWFATIKLFCRQFKHSNTNTGEVIQFFNTQLNRDFTKVFHQYLKYKYPPVLVYSTKKKKNYCELTYHWLADVANFDMPVDILWGNNTKRIYPTPAKQTILLPEEAVGKVAVYERGFLVNTKITNSK